jgi:hypothetical protein
MKLFIIDTNKKFVLDIKTVQFYFFPWKLWYSTCDVFYYTLYVPTSQHVSSRKDEFCGLDTNKTAFDDYTLKVHLRGYIYVSAYNIWLYITY